MQFNAKETHKYAVDDDDNGDLHVFFWTIFQYLSISHSAA